MSYNFKTIADVEVVEGPSENTKILVEENGKIKRLPVDYDYADALISYTYSWTDETINIQLLHGDYNKIKTKIQSGIEPVIKIVEEDFYQLGNDKTVYKPLVVLLRYYDGYEWIEICAANTTIYFSPDNQVD